MKSVGFEDINKLFKKINAYHYCLETSVTPTDNDFLHRFIKNLDPLIDNIIEIGTFNGIATLVFASVANIVHTFDVAYRNAEYLWSFFPELRSKISYCVGSQEAIDDTIRRILFANTKYFNFNFAFIDGKHTYENAAYDFNLVKFCGRILFHDADMEGIKSFVKQIGAKIFDGTKFAYWEDG